MSDFKVVDGQVFSILYREYSYIGFSKENKGKAGLET